MALLRLIGNPRSAFHAQGASLTARERRCADAHMRRSSQRQDHYALNPAAHFMKANGYNLHFDDLPKLVGEFDDSEDINEEVRRSVDFSRFKHIKTPADYIRLTGELAPREGETVPGIITRIDRKWAYVEVGAKMLAQLPRDECYDEEGEMEHTQFRPGDRIRVKVMNYDHETGIAMVSMREAVEDEAWDKVMDAFDNDQTLNATIDFASVNEEDSAEEGYYVTVEGLPGFLHSGEVVGWSLDPEMQGKVLPVKVLMVNYDRKEIELSNREAVAEQQSSMEDGQVVEGKVSALMPFGAIVDLGVMSGLLHVDEFSSEPVDNLDEILEIGDAIKAVVINAEEGKRQISLSTRRLEKVQGEILSNRQLVFDEAYERVEAGVHTQTATSKED